jgi:hypothetical protein
VTGHLDQVLAAVGSRVEHLAASATAQAPTEPGWHDCAAITVADLDRALDEAGPGDRQVAASLLLQSYAYRVAAVSLAAYAVGLPWPSPAAAATSVRLAGGRARGVRFGAGPLGPAGDAGSLAEALFPGHLVRTVAAVRASQRLGERLVWANVAASCAAAFRAVEGAARARGDAVEQGEVRARALALFEQAPWLASTGSFEACSAEWRWQRSACCLWYRTSGGRTCEGCSLTRAEGA